MLDVNIPFECREHCPSIDECRTLSMAQTALRDKPTDQAQNFANVVSESLGEASVLLCKGPSPFESESLKATFYICQRNKREQ